MSWWNNAGDLWGDITRNTRDTLDPLGYATRQTGGNENSIGDRFNTAKPLVIGAATGGLSDAIGGATPTNPGTTPVYGNDIADASVSLPGFGGDSQSWLTKMLGGISGGDLLKAGGSALGAGVSAYDNAKQIAERKREFDAAQAQQLGEFNRTTGDTEAQAAVRAATELNKAPLADKSQALLLARLGASPTAFQPRDFTKTGDVGAALSTPATGGPADSLAADQRAAAAYRPGAGGVDTDTLRLLIAKLRGSSGLNTQTPYQGTQPTVTTPPGSLPSIYRVGTRSNDPRGYA